ncbi:MAG: molybdopterin-dependent oxidoreductase, partial [Clostridia bacterium]|nr:molybdopterin-dependent oxidoreductase [Clostridia bacterium]
MGFVVRITVYEDIQKDVEIVPLAVLAVGFEEGSIVHVVELTAAGVVVFAQDTFRVRDGIDCSWDEETGHGKAYFTWVYGCQAAEIAINPKTGKIRLINAAATHDVGKAVNPPFVIGQINGGMAQGFGYGTMEDLGIKDGRISNLNLGKYKIPKANELPDFIVTLVENYDPM